MSGKHKLPWIEKYRPLTLNEVSDHGDKILTLKNLNNNKELPHLLFYGPPGTGKTSTILALASEMYGDQCKKYILELNASDDRGIETVRTKIPDFISTTSNQIKMVILDEVDAMTTEAQSALRRVIERSSKNCRFILICNNINKIIAGLISRCTKMRFPYLNAEKIMGRMQMIIEKENIKITNDALKFLIETKKDFRQILNDMQCLHAFKSVDNANYESITVDEIYEYCGIPTQSDIENIIVIVFENDYEKACELMIDIFKNNKWNLSDLIHKLAQYVVKHQNMKCSKKHYLIDKLSDIEAKLSSLNDSEIQIYGLISAFQQSKLI